MSTDTLFEERVADVSLPDAAPLALRSDRPPTIEDLMSQAIQRGDTETMGKLYEMHREMRQEAAKTAFNAAMNRTQQEMRHIAANAVNPQTKSRYATYDKLDSALRPIYTKNGFALSFDTGDAPLPDYVRVLCDVSHEGGFTRLYKVDMPADGKGAKGGDVMTKTHAAGAAMSYGMRYLLKMIFNVAIGEDDTDGNAPIQTVNESQVANLQSLIEEVKADKVKFLKWAQVDRLDEIRASEYSRCVKMLEAKRK